MDGSISGFTELTASQHSTAQHQQYCLLLGLGCLLEVGGGEQSLHGPCAH